MNIYRKKLYGIIGALTILSGCTMEIPEGDIKDFVEAINYNTTFDKVDYGKSVIEVKHYTNEDEVAGTLKITTCFDKENEELYYYNETNVTGNYYGNAEGQYSYYNQKSLVYSNDNEIVEAFRNTDDVIQETQHSIESLTDLIEGFFYNKVDAGYHTGGMYYGDYVQVNCGKYYELFSLSEAKDVLTYKVTTSSMDSDKNEILTMHEFSINKLGMLLELSTTTAYVSKPEKVVTTISCDYSGEFEKLKTL